MPQTVLNRASEQIAGSMRVATRVKTAVTDAFEDGVGAAKRVVKRSGVAAEEFLDDSTRYVRRHPFETVLTSLAVGLTIGVMLGWLIKAKPRLG